MDLLHPCPSTLQAHVPRGDGSSAVIIHLMKTYVAFLRAINVSAGRGVKMEDLKQVFKSFDLENVQTFIQSGNVIFESKNEVGGALVKLIESRLETMLGYKSDVFLRTIEEVTAIANQRFYKPKEDETMHIVFLNEAPDKKAHQALISFNSQADDFKVKGREVYNLRRDRNKSVFSNNFVERILKAPATTRNLTTVKKIVEKYG